MNNRIDSWLNVTSLIEDQAGDTVVLDRKSILRLKNLIAKLNSVLKSGEEIGVFSSKQRLVVIEAAKISLTKAMYYTDAIENGQFTNYVYARAQLERMYVDTWSTVERKKAELSKCKNPNLDDIPFGGHTRSILRSHNLNTVSDLAAALSSGADAMPKLSGIAKVQCIEIVDIYGRND